MGNFDVYVNVTQTSNGEHEVLHININPESVPLDGRSDSTITWTITDPDSASFQDMSDIQFITQGGQNRFVVEFVSPTQMTATVKGVESDQTIYTYYITVHLKAINAAIRVDPEVDNPPPPPGP
jgi:hypothetical protein